MDNLKMLQDVNINITVELGSKRHSIADILKFTPGTVVELDSQAGESVKVYANEKLIGYGELVVIGDVYGVRLIQLLK